MGTPDKPPLLLFLSQLSLTGLGPIVSTLAWMARRAGHRFDLYIDSYHLGIHYGGSHAEAVPEGALTGGTVVAGRHVEALYQLLPYYDIRAVILGDSYLRLTLESLGVPIIAKSDNLLELYKSVVSHLEIGPKPDLIVVGDRDGMDSYAWPEIVRLECSAVAYSYYVNHLVSAGMPGPARGLFLTEVEEKEIGVEESLLRFKSGEDIGSITRRMADRHVHNCGGWLFADPVCALHWIPTAVEDRLLPLYSQPSRASIDYIAAHPGVGHSAILGRQTHDDDFFTLSRAGRSLQVIDPNRPPFQSVRHIPRNLASFHAPTDPSDPTDPSNEELATWAQEGTIVSSLVFWSGAIREVENFYALVDLIARHRLHCGFAVCAQTVETMPHEPFGLVSVPVENGGVAGLVELLLGSAGLGIAIEGDMPPDALKSSLLEAMARLRARIDDPALIPTGWWVTMDAPLKQGKAPFPLEFHRASPRIRIRYTKKRSRPSGPGQGTELHPAYDQKPSLKQWMQARGLDRYFEPWRPFESMAPGDIAPHILDCGKAAGLNYLFTKSGFAPGKPRIVHADADLIALNYTTGRWDGWTPFETINHVSDLERSERMLLSSGKPGWILGTIDSCLWTFGGHLLERGADLENIARFFVKGGRSTRIRNVRPNVVARYARILKSLGCIS